MTSRTAAPVEPVRSSALLRALRRQAGASKGFLDPRVLWFATLLAAICFEGHARKYLLEIPAPVFYFLKDAVLLGGLAFGIKADVRRLMFAMYGAFVPILIIAVVITVIQTLNPEHQSFPLALIGLRAYWLWWLAPLIVASVLQSSEQRQRAVFLLAVVSLIIAATAAYQWSQPATAPVNSYARFDGEQRTEIAVTIINGRARVSSTFSFLTGFNWYCVLASVLLISLGIAAERAWVRQAAVVSTTAMALTLPMGGSRGPLILGGAMVALVVARAGLLRTRSGRRLAVGIVAGTLGVTLLGSEDLIEGVRDRFGGDDTGSRFSEQLNILPPVALWQLPYPWMGIGTGMQQNARDVFRVRTDWAAEGEPSRYLAELGPFGYLAVWLARFGLFLALIRASQFLKARKRMAASGGAVAFSIVLFFGNLTFDHIFQALWFTGAGLFLHEVVTEARAMQAEKSLLQASREQQTRTREPVAQPSNDGTGAPKPELA